MGSAFLRRQQQQPQRRCSSCYRQQRSDMLSLSLHKLHAARQRSDSSLRRSVLICNMLRYIEDESSTEQREEQEAAAAAQQQQQLSFHQQQQQHHSHHHHQEQQQQQSYWVGGLSNFAPPLTPNPYRDGSPHNSSVCGGVGSGGGGGGVSFSCGPDSEASAISGGGGGFDAPLKDFNSAFRQTPIPSPSPASAVGGSEGGQQDVGGSEDEERGGGGGSSSGGGINWSSVLSLSSQAELDPLNNNTYHTDAHQHGLWPGSLGGGGVEMTDVDLSHHSFDDISWKLSPISADEVLKAFPEENLFQCAA